MAFIFGRAVDKQTAREAFKDAACPVQLYFWRRKFSVRIHQNIAQDGRSCKIIQEEIQVTKKLKEEVGKQAASRC